MCCPNFGSIRSSIMEILRFLCLDWYPSPMPFEPGNRRSPVQIQGGPNLKFFFFFFHFFFFISSLLQWVFFFFSSFFFNFNPFCCHGCSGSLGKQTFGNCALMVITRNTKFCWQVHLARLHYILYDFPIWPTFQGHRGQTWKKPTKCWYIPNLGLSNQPWFF